MSLWRIGLGKPGPWIGNPSRDSLQKATKVTKVGLAFVSFVIFCSCSSAPKHHSAPSAAPVRKAIAIAQDSIAAAQHDVESIKTTPDNNAVVVALKRHLFDAQNELRTAQNTITDLETQVAVHVDRENVLEGENAKLKSKKSFNFLGLANMAIGFISNPFSFIITRLIELAIGILAIALFICLLRIVIRRIKAKRWKLTLPK